MGFFLSIRPRISIKYWRLFVRPSPCTLIQQNIPNEKPQPINKTSVPSVSCTCRTTRAKSLVHDAEYNLGVVIVVSEHPLKFKTTDTKLYRRSFRITS